MDNRTAEIFDVTDTALWIAAYRAQESQRQDALFRDPFAELLIGKLGALIATRTQGSRYTAWSVVIRTYIIDQFISKLIPQDIDTVLNLGAGLDTRPYRLSLPSQLRWIEVDFPNIIDHKNNLLKKEMPNCYLERVAFDLSDLDKRNIFLEKISQKAKNVLILTEGVVPYLSNSEALSLAQTLHQFDNFNYWISEYYSPEILKFLRTPKRIEQMKNAPFLFYPEDWYKFFSDAGWNAIETKYFGKESEKLGRTPPTPGWLKTEGNKEHLQESVKSYLGYSIFERRKLI